MIDKIAKLPPLPVTEVLRLLVEMGRDARANGKSPPLATFTTRTGPATRGWLVAAELGGTRGAPLLIASDMDLVYVDAAMIESVRVHGVGEHL